MESICCDADRKKERKRRTNEGILKNFFNLALTTMAGMIIDNKIFSKII